MGNKKKGGSDAYNTLVSTRHVLRHPGFEEKEINKEVYLMSKGLLFFFSWKTRRSSTLQWKKARDTSSGIQ